MAKIIKPIFAEDDVFVSTRNRFFTVFKPIQSTRGTKYINRKDSDFFSYLLNPVIDIVLAPVFLLDILIDVTNLVLSLVKAAYRWSHNQQSTESFFDLRTRGELSEAKDHFLYAISALFSAVINPILSILSLGTRPIASIVKAIADGCEECTAPSSRI
ncbi:hypothetical protein [Legionella hackeliae]|uniref:Uncharacterized protein n=1 Tax=Legionella hackeliae TaxID=449 RepID=A0A0A8UU98_LEGHA|nr:hypothetical protein [Legionella hackeliae]KTD08929.1 hypothetical protein Lhac_3152 [Legionella hackeliae]CEK10359.1 conserved protein of unknown function [Legionella hackeliae]STX47095.1 Uncharacterised protein [Legionella hackeliae]